ncbi:MAG: GAF domain-containing protein [Chloroflexota bacterium]
MNPLNPILWFKRLLDQTGGYFLLLVVTLAQLAAYLFTVPISLFVAVNAEFTLEHFRQLWGVALLGMILTLGILLVYIYYSNRQAFSLLQDYKKGSASPFNEERELAAWKQISSLPWQYARSSVPIMLLVAYIPTLVYGSMVHKLPLDQMIYMAIGMIISLLSVITLGMFTLEGIIAPARQVLLPKSHQAQLVGITSLKILPRLNIVVLTLVVMGILLVAPIGYHFTYLAIQSPDQPDLLQNYQIQSLGFSAIALLLGAGLAWMLSQSVSVPLNHLVEVFQKVEQGDLSQTAPVVTSDEIGELTIFFNRMLENVESLQSKLREQVAERTAQLSAVNEVGQSIGSILDPELLINRVVNLITDRFGHYYSAIFLLDKTGKWAELKSATGEAGRVLRESRHRLAVDSKSMVGTAISQKEARIALDVGQEPVRFNNPLLPYTRSEIALPLIVGDRILGALDVQSTREAAFGQEDIQTLQNMANQVAVALENARLFQETNQRIQELQATQRQYVREAWSSLAAGAPLEYKVGDETPFETETVINVPIALRDEVIGQINLTGEREWSPEEQAWVEAVATQAAVALENARLMEESRKQAGIERTVADITTRVWSVSSIDGILQTAVKEIGRALNLSEATIELSVDDQGEANRE